MIKQDIQPFVVLREESCSVSQAVEALNSGSFQWNPPYVWNHSYRYGWYAIVYSILLKVQLVSLRC